MKHVMIAVAVAALSLSACSVDADPSEAVAAIELPTLLNPNLASAEEMRAAGIAPGVTDAVVANRPFADGVEFARFAQQAGAEDALDVAFIPLPLNSTAEADFMLIPGIGEKMAHEIEEYRPYTSMEQFDFEIGKYVGVEELARIRRYVTLDD